MPMSLGVDTTIRIIEDVLLTTYTSFRLQVAGYRLQSPAYDLPLATCRLRLVACSVQDHTGAASWLNCCNNSCELISWLLKIARPMSSSSNSSGSRTR